MSNDATGGTGRTPRTPRTAAPTAPLGSTVAIVVTAAAVILGFLILRKVNDDSSSTSTPVVTTTTTIAGAVTTLGADTTTTLAVDKTATKIQVANASNAPGTAKQMSIALADAGWITGTPTNATLETKLEVSKVIFNAQVDGARAIAKLLAEELGGIKVSKSANPPVETGGYAEGSAVILLLGNDLAGKTLAQIQGATVTGVTAPPTTLAGVVTVTT